ncbi:MAG: chromate efflux transporter [Planctomycetota bacterium]
MPHATAGQLFNLARVFLKLGCIGFGGPAAHLSLMEREIVDERQWLSREQFLDFLAAVYIVPGPQAVQMAGHIGMRRAGIAGLVVAAFCLCLPGVLLALPIAWVYSGYGSLPHLAPALRGIQPVVVALLITTLLRLTRQIVAQRRAVVILVAVAVMNLAGMRELAALAVGAVAGTILLSVPLRSGKSAAGLLLPVIPCLKTAPWLAAGPVVSAPAVAAGAPAAASAWSLALFLLQTAAVWYGGGYVLMAYLQGGLVEARGWLTQQQLLDAAAVGQITPGPALSMVTFAGYLIAGWPGAILGTIAVATPSLVLVGLLGRPLAWLRAWKAAQSFFRAIHAASVGLVAAMAVVLVRATIVDAASPLMIDVAGALIAVAALLLLLRWKPSPVWLLLGGAVAGSVLYRV